MRLIVVSNFGAWRSQEEAGDWLDIQEKIHFEIYNGVHLLRELPRVIVFLPYHFHSSIWFLRGQKLQTVLVWRKCFSSASRSGLVPKDDMGIRLKTYPPTVMALCDSLRFSPPDGHWFPVFPRQTLAFEIKMERVARAPPASVTIKSNDFNMLQ